MQIFISPRIYRHQKKKKKKDITILKLLFIAFFMPSFSIAHVPVLLQSRGRADPTQTQAQIPEVPSRGVLISRGPFAICKAN